MAHFLKKNQTVNAKVWSCEKLYYLSSKKINFRVDSHNAEIHEIRELTFCCKTKSLQSLQKSDPD